MFKLPVMLGFPDQLDDIVGMRQPNQDRITCVWRCAAPLVLQVGPELPEPCVVAWDPTLRYLALAYLRQVQVLRAQPTLEVLGSVPIVGTTCAVWGIRQLYIATPTSILLAFVAAEEAPPAGEGLSGVGRQPCVRMVYTLLCCWSFCWTASCIQASVPACERYPVFTDDSVPVCVLFARCCSKCSGSS